VVSGLAARPGAVGRDRIYMGWQHAAPAAEPGPPPRRPVRADPDQVSQEWLAAQRGHERRLSRPARLAGAAAGAAGLVTGASWLTGWLPSGLGALVCGCAALVAVRCAASVFSGRRQLRADIAAEQLRVARFRALRQRQFAAAQSRHATEVRGWQQRAAAFGRQPHWYGASLPAGVHRIDVAGGTVAGWSALLTTIAATRLAAGGEVTVLDLTEGGVAADLLALARGAGIEPLVWVLPADLPVLPLGADLRGDALADVLALTVAAGGATGDGGTARPPADAASDAALLGRVLALLGPEAGLPHLVAALRSLAHAADPSEILASGLLTSRQLSALAAAFGRDLQSRLVVDRAWAIAAALRPVELLGTRLTTLPPSRLSLAWIDRRADAAGSRALAAYLAVALTAAQRRAAPGPPWQQTVVLLGAERLPTEVLDRLTDACESAGTGLACCYRSVPGHVAARLGRGEAAVAFMRLGNAQDARVAAEHIGTEHTFVLSQLTETVSSSLTDTTGDSYTSTVGTADSLGASVSRTGTAGRSSGRGRQGSWLAGPGGLAGSGRSASQDASVSLADSESVSVTEGINAGTSWGLSTSSALGVNASLAWAAQRSREFVVEQHELQHLPASAVLLCVPGRGGGRVLLADANPAIMGLPTATMSGLSEYQAEHRRPR
jgi:hypothetical protein